MATFTLITGASTGIGRELAELCAADRRNVVLLARSEDKLQSLADALRERYAVDVEVLVQDLEKPEAPETTRAELSSRGVEIDALINNAGFGYLGPFHEADPDNQLGMLQLNVTALTQLTRLFLPDFVARGRGQILNIASMASFQPGPFMAVYYATKAYVLSFSEALSEELRGTGVTVTALCPGVTATGFQARARTADSNLIRFGTQDARGVARVGYRAMVRGKAVAIPGLANRFLALVVRLSPRAAVRRVVRRLNLGS
jgi:short-subunit dehydrogenase